MTNAATIKDQQIITATEARRLVEKLDLTAVIDRGAVDESYTADDLLGESGIESKDSFRLCIIDTNGIKLELLDDEQFEICLNSPEKIAGVERNEWVVLV